ncbi:MAG TPA: DUF6311 domain-containing protein [Candidatus Magasanikbacteria bacterium]|nr:DUF6311 domain-containing protein [Candidatus Magasanikbacteria bacterium]
MIISGALGAVLFLLLYSELLDTSYIEWTLWIGGDPFQHYIGWELFRDSPWSFPIGQVSHLVYPHGVPLTFTDSIPLFSFFFKLFSEWLPFPFQFDGIWILSCFVLQGMFGYALTYQYLQKKALSVIGSIFFILSPIMLFRLGGHSALGAHWIILWSLWLGLKNGKMPIWQWTAILLLTVLIHPYLLFMCGALFVADLVRRIVKLHVLSWKKGSIFFVIEVGLVLMLSWIVGVFSTGSGAAPGYGVFSLDLNSLINPYGWSTIIKNMNVREPNEGFAYLGLGIIILLGLSLFQLVQDKKYTDIKRKMYEWWPVVAVVGVLTLLAITNTVSVWGKEIFSIPLSEYVREHIMGVVRSSGRLFWPVYYLIVLASFFIIKKSRTYVAYGLMIFAVLVQGYDFKDKLLELDNFYEAVVWHNPLNDPFWSQAAHSIEHISFVPSYALGKYETIALFAAEHNMTLNTGYVVRAAGLLNKDFMDAEVRSLQEGIVADNTLYIFLDEKTGRTMTEKVDKTLYKVKTIDGYTVLAPVGMLTEKKEI